MFRSAYHKRQVQGKEKILEFRRLSRRRQQQERIDRHIAEHEEEHGRHAQHDERPTSAAWIAPERPAAAAAPPLRQARIERPAATPTPKGRCSEGPPTVVRAAVHGWRGWPRSPDSTARSTRASGKAARAAAPGPPTRPRPERRPTGRSGPSANGCGRCGRSSLDHRPGDWNDGIVGGPEPRGKRERGRGKAEGGGRKEACETASGKSAPSALRPPPSPFHPPPCGGARPRLQ